MKTLHLLAAVSLCIAASLTSRAESPELVAHAKNSLTDGKSTSLIEQIDAPNVQTATISKYTPTEDPYICRKEARLGTRIVRLVCRSRAEMAAETEAAEKLLRKRNSWNDSGPKNPG